jgi:N-glycosylase/DNA lyase
VKYIYLPEIGAARVSSREFSLAQIADSGQCFRLTRTSPERWRLIAGRRVLRLETVPGGTLFYCTEEEFRSVWRRYFDLTAGYRRYRSAVPEEDGYLRSAVRFGRGIRILRQDPWEMLVTFIISQRKNIPAIRLSVEKLCARCGEPLPGGLFAFPAAERLAALPQEELALCSLGYRTGYIHAAARMAAEGELDFAALARSDDETLRQALLAVPGVGVKVAECVMLFGFHRLRGFPVDVWIGRTLREHYPDGLDLTRYAGFEGVIQQYLFYYARSGETSAPGRGD